MKGPEDSSGPNCVNHRIVKAPNFVPVLKNILTALVKFVRVDSSNERRLHAQLVSQIAINNGMVQILKTIEHFKNYER